jgi:hypothetical protein
LWYIYVSEKEENYFWIEKEKTHNPLLLIIKKRKKSNPTFQKKKITSLLGCRLHLLIG